MRGREAFIWHAGLQPIGLPMALALTVWQWRRQRSMRAALAGTAVFGVVGRHWRTALAGGVAIAALRAMGGGVVPVVNSRRAARLWTGFLVVGSRGGVLLALGYRRLVAPPTAVAHVEQKYP